MPLPNDIAHIEYGLLVTNELAPQHRPRARVVILWRATWSWRYLETHPTCRADLPS